MDISIWIFTIFSLTQNAQNQVSQSVNQSLLLVNNMEFGLWIDTVLDNLIELSNGSNVQL